MAGLGQAGECGPSSTGSQKFAMICGNQVAAKPGATPGRRARRGISQIQRAKPV